MDLMTTLHHLGVTLDASAGPDLRVCSPIDGALLASLRCPTRAEVDASIAHAVEAFLVWRDVPAPHRGTLVRLFGEAVRAHKEPLARLVTLDNGKILDEARGEVQEMIDMCDFAVGLPRQLYGLTIATERPDDRMQETWLPLGPIGVLTAFNFPVAVWAWNAAVALVCGDPVIWKPSEKTPLTALACHNVLDQVIADFEGAPSALSSVVAGGASVGEQMAASTALPLISATGSVRMGRAVARTVAGRLGRFLMELGGNNGMIVAPTANLDLALRSIVFAAAGTCGQRCTSLRRLFVHESIADDLKDRLLSVF